MKHTDIAWAAGFIDGEGCFTTSRNKENNKDYLHFALSQRSEVPGKPAFVLRKLQRIVGGKLYTHDAAKGYQLKIGKGDDVRALAKLVWRWLGPVKRRQFKEACKRAES